MRLPRAALFYAGLATILPLAIAQKSRQLPLMSQSDAPAVADDSSPLLLSDTMASQRSLSLFASLARDDYNTSSQFEDKSGYTIVLAPTNTAIKAMRHKPWENPDEANALGGHAYKGETGMDRAQRNLERFVQRCLVTGGSTEWPEGEKRRRGGDGKQVWWEAQGGKRVVMPDKIPVVGIVSRVVNGEIWAMEATFDE